MKRRGKILEKHEGQGRSKRRHPVFEALTGQMRFTGELKDDVHLFLVENGCPKTAEHCLEVGAEARRLALLFGTDPEACETAGWLHDISAVIPNHQRIEASRLLGIEVLPEEEQFPMIIHQKLSKVMAGEIFQVDNIEILNAVGCHTTLRAQATLLDQILFVADKLAWDQPGIPPYMDLLNEALGKSAAHAAFAYINYLWQRKETLRVIHPWLGEAYEELQEKLQ
jgi:predicted HD superfamily hydrolase involved in NAD metabolism